MAQSHRAAEVPPPAYGSSSNNLQHQQVFADLRPPSSASCAQQQHQQQRLQNGVLGSSTAHATSSSASTLSSRSLNEIRPGGGRETMVLHDPPRPVRTLPTWVQRRDDDDDDVVQIPPMTPRRPPERSLHDAKRESTPVTPFPHSQHASRWRNFLDGTAYPPNTSHSEKVNADWLAQQPDLESPWLANNTDTENAGESTDDHETLFVSKKKRRIWYKRLHIMLLNSPVVPLTFRSIIWVLSLLALALAGSIFHMSNQYNVPQGPSTIMAIVVDAIALLYLIWITYDEYSGKPLGLRSPSAKIRLIMLDLLFIVFDSANLSLAFDTVYDVRWSCRSADFQEGTMNSDIVNPICNRQRALAAFLFLALCAWVSTFMVSVFRVVERVSSSR